MANFSLYCSRFRHLKIAVPKGELEIRLCLHYWSLWWCLSAILTTKRMNAFSWPKFNSLFVVSNKRIVWGYDELTGPRFSSISRKMSEVSSHLNWLIVRDHNAFLMKQRNIKKPFSTVRINFNFDSLLNSSCYYDDIYLSPRSLSIAQWRSNLLLLMHERKPKKKLSR
jgi:hypothetical protein